MSAEQEFATEIRTVNPKSLKPRDSNARYMTADQLELLTENIKRDGKLTSLPLVHVLDNGDLEIISGHHRTLASIAAGFAEIDVICVTSELDDSRITALQLSHNAISGQDDKSILASLYESLDLVERKYSGLTDDVLGEIGKVDVAGLSLGVIEYQQLRIDFLPEDASAFEAALKKLGKVGAKQTQLVARYEDFDAVFDTLIAVKAATNTYNAGMALRLMADLALERLDELEQEEGENAAE
jgi:hypothetical protein